MKGIVLAGGQGTRLYPLTIAVSKQLLPIYDKPLIYYSLTTLMLLGINDILIITTPYQKNDFINLLGNGEQFGINIEYDVQEKPSGIAESFIIGEKFIDNNPVTLILGDNFFYGINSNQLKFKNLDKFKGGLIFSYSVPDPENFGVIFFNKNKISKIVEKPKKPKSNVVATGLYIYDANVTKYAKLIKPSKRNELEITDINNIYIKKKLLSNIHLKEGSVWLDTGTYESLFQASLYVKIMQERNQILIGSPELIALSNKWIAKKKIIKNINKYQKNQYYSKLEKIILVK